MVYSRLHHVVVELRVEGTGAANVAVIIDGCPNSARKLSDHKIGVLDVLTLLVYNDLALVSRNYNSLRVRDDAVDSELIAGRLL